MCILHLVILRVEGNQISISDEERVNVAKEDRYMYMYTQCDSSEGRVGCGPHLGCLGVKRVFGTRSSDLAIIQQREI